MHIGIETECLNQPITGVQLATLDLIKGLALEDKQITCFHAESSFHPYFENVQHHLFGRFSKIPYAKSFCSLFRSSCFEKVDILHLSAPRFSYLKRPKVPLVMTVHDVGPLSHPHFYGRKNRFFYKYFLSKYLSDVDAIITPAEFNKTELLRFFKLKEEKIHVIPFGLSDPPVASCNKKEPILVYIGTRHPRKNVRNLLDAYAILLSKGFSYKLVLLGNPLTKDEFSDWVSKHSKFQDCLVDRSFVCENEKRDWLQRASLLVMPSFYEGFGFPILEALASGTPVIGSNVSAIPEVLGDGGILIDPNDPQSIAVGICQAVASPEGYEALVARALTRASQFSHKKMIGQILSVYEHIL